jgi:hypothetical protein
MFLFLSFMVFFFYKTREQEGRTGTRLVGHGYWHQWEGEVVGKWGRRMNTVHIIYTCM